MSSIATIAVGTAVVGAYASNRAAKKQSKAARQGAQTAADASVQSTELQIEEMQRQFDYQQQVLLPQIERQYAAQEQYSNLLGIGAPSKPLFKPVSPGSTQTAKRPSTPSSYTPGIGSSVVNFGEGGERNANYYKKLLQASGHSAVQGRGNMGGDPITGKPEPSQRPVRTAKRTPDRSGMVRGSPAPGDPVYPLKQPFVDPNLDPTRLADQQQLVDQVEGSRLAAPTAAQDEYVNYINRNQIAADSIEDDLRFQRARDVTNAGESLESDQLYQNISGRSLAEGAAGTGVYEDEFESSPGYSFAVEQMGRELDRRNSAGGNYGGRAIMEAQRRAQGLANQEYYSWAAGRERDLGRLGAAESADAARLDSAGANYLSRRGVDIQRGDQAVGQYRGERIADIQRQDQAMQDYSRRQEGDVSRMDAAIRERDRLAASDQARQDQAYYNYLQNISQQAGFGGGSAAQAVNASQQAGQSAQRAYAQQGSQLSSIYGNLGAQQAQIAGDKYANMNNAFQSGVSNYITYRNSQA